MIPFNKPYLTGKEMHYIYQAVYSGKISGNGIYTQKCPIILKNNMVLKKHYLQLHVLMHLKWQQFCAIFNQVMR